MNDSRLEFETLARVFGFSTVRFAAVGSTPHADHYDRWLAAGKHADMDYLARGRDVRHDPRSRLPEAKTAVVLSLEHHHRRPPDPGGMTGMVARYAWGRDYHNLIGKRLRKLRKSLRERGIASWGGVDTAPILERSWAAEAGLGFGGKNCMQIIPARTSWMFLAVIFVDVEIPPDPPLRDHCGRCSRCLDACPTKAFVGPRDLDARKCIAYWTIESRGLAPRALRPHFGRWVFGCDVCQEVCPHNVSPPDATEQDLLPRHAWLDLNELMMTPDEALLERFTGTPLRRPRGEGLKRNALIALGNMGHADSLAAIEAGMSHESPVVRGAAIWALGRVGSAPPLTFVPTTQLEHDELHALREGEIEPCCTES